MIDSRGVGKPNALGNKDANDLVTFRGFRLKFVNYVSSVFPEAEDLLKDAQEAVEEITSDSLATIAHTVPNVRKIVAQLRATLIGLLEEEPLDILMACPEGPAQVLEGWRQLNARFDPCNANKNLGLLQKLLAVKPVSLSTLRSTVLKWEESLRQYERRSGDKVGDTTRRVCMIGFLAEPLLTHVNLNISKFPDYVALRSAVFSYIEQTDAQSVPQPMDTSSVDVRIHELEAQIAALSKGKSKGKGKQQQQTQRQANQQQQQTGQRFEGECDFCHKYGHKARDCRKKQREQQQNQTDSGRQGDGGRVVGAGSGGKGVGKGRGNAGNTGKGKGKGKSGKATNSLEEAVTGQDVWPDDAAAGGIFLGTLSPSSYCCLSVSSRLPGFSWHAAPVEGWQRVDLTLDSGAACTVVPPSLCPKLPLMPVARPRTFRTATAEPVVEQGHKELQLTSQAGINLRLNSSVVDVHKPLLAASAVVDAGGAVFLEKDNSWMRLGKSEHWEPLLEQNGLFVLPVWVCLDTAGSVSSSPLLANIQTAQSSSLQPLFPRQVQPLAPQARAWGQTL